MSDAATNHHVRTVGLAGLLRQGLPPDPHAAEREQEAALELAYTSGLRDGEAAAFAALTDARAQQLAEHAAAIAAARDAQQFLAETIAENLAALAIQVARAVISAEPLLRLETLQSLISEALAAAPAEGGGIVFVTPSELSAAQDAIPPGWASVADPDLAPGTARAALGPSAFTASLDRRLSQLATRMAEAD